MPENLPAHGTTALWPAAPCPYGIGQWWLKSSDEGTLAIIPPGAIGDLEEDPDARTCWRTLWWPVDCEHDDPWGPDGERSRASIVPVTDVLVLVGAQQVPRVRLACENQLAHLRRFSSGHGGRPDDVRAREASRILSRLHRELEDAFPQERWHARELAQLESVPNTAGELLRAVDGVGSSRAERVLEVLLRQYWRAIGAYRAVKRVRTQPHMMTALLAHRPKEPPRAEPPRRDTGDQLPIGQ
jgi:hypothetical protein